MTAPAESLGFEEGSPVKLSSAREQVHVWRVALECGPEEEAQLRALLTAQETERAERYRFEKDRHSFIVRRGVLRLLLGWYLDTGPFRPAFTATDFGRPILPAGAAGANLRFSVSHSGGLALLAFARDREIGVDVEQVRGDLDYCAISSLYFSEGEQASLRLLPSEMRREAFFACWSRKEAYIKARGQGLSIPLDLFDVTLHPEEPAQILAIRDRTDPVPIWSMSALDVGPGFAAALVVEGQGAQILRRAWCGTDPFLAGRRPIV